MPNSCLSNRLSGHVVRALLFPRGGTPVRRIRISHEKAWPELIFFLHPRPFVLAKIVAYRRFV
jgi:hypothetical protein